MHIKRTNGLLAFDLGASSVRALRGDFDGERLTLTQAHRFENTPIKMDGHLYWNMPYLINAMEQGLARAAQLGPISCAGVDTWGVDYGLIGADGNPVTLPRHYRDTRIQGLREEANAVLSAEKLYTLTGIAPQPFNTLLQLLADQRAGMLNGQEKLLFMPDLLTYYFTAQMGTEYTIASTSEMLCSGTAYWSKTVLDAFQLPYALFSAPMQMPGAIRGNLRTKHAERLGVPTFPFAAVASHDTASAVVAAAVDTRWAYLSSGTWSLLGVERDAPMNTQAALAAGYSNEGGLGGKTRLLRNIMGLWIIQECRRAWRDEGNDLTFAQIALQAEESPAFACFINVDDSRFCAPGDMPQKVQAYCMETGQPVPQSIGAIARCVYESLSMKYRECLQGLEQLTNERIDQLCIVGGGSQNDLLNRFTANAIGRPVLAGPAEATAIGNLMMQAVALRWIDHERDIRRVVHASFPRQEYLPTDRVLWEDAFGAYQRVCNP